MFIRGAIVKNVSVFMHVPTQKWFWFIVAADGQCRQYGPFKIEAMARKDAYFQMGGPIIDAMHKNA